VKSQFQIASEKGMSQAMFDVDLKVRLSLLSRLSRLLLVRGGPLLFRDPAVCGGPSLSQWFAAAGTQSRQAASA
jgi:hypothetical protein